MPTSPHRRVQRERRYSMLQLRGDVRGCNGHRRRRMVQITTYPGTMPVAFAREGETARKSLFLRCSRTSGMPPGLTTLNFKSEWISWRVRHVRMHYPL